MSATKLLGMFDRVVLPVFRFAILGGLPLVAATLVAQG
jgi:hypothetical protein